MKYYWTILAVGTFVAKHGGNLVVHGTSVDADLLKLDRYSSSRATGTTISKKTQITHWNISPSFLYFLVFLYSSFELQDEQKQQNE